jgi:glycosyltransferase involved in cell wall biosynthesis
MSVLISVVVCTFNRSDLLANLLEGLCLQAVEKPEYEIIVVDNNSRDDTRDVVRGFCKAYPNVRYCFEGRQGLSRARNRGWRKARGEYVAYIDDDCKAPEQWLAVARAVILEKSPGVLGGPYYAFYNSPKPAWWRDRYRSCEHGERPRALRENEYLSGNNIFFRREILQTLGGFDTRLGMSGGSLAYGEETALLRCVRNRMPDELIYYDPALFVYHLVPVRKMSLLWTARQRFADGHYSYLVFRNGNAGSDVGHRRLLKKGLKTLLVLVSDLGRGLFYRDRCKYPYFENFLFEEVLCHFRGLGGLYGQHESRFGENAGGTRKQK